MTVSRSLAMLSIVFQDKKTSDEFYAIYQEMLSDLPDEAVVEGVKGCLCSCRFFPTIAEIRTNAQPYLENLRERQRLEYNERRQIAAEEEKKNQKEVSWSYTKEVVRYLEDKKIKGTATRLEIEKLDRLREALIANEENN